MNRRQSNGFTLVELLVAVGILGIVVAGAMESFVVQNDAYTVVDQTTETQQNLRAVANLLERDVRMTGFMVPEGAAVCAVDVTNASDVLYVTDSEAIDPDGQSAATLGAGVTNYTGASGTQTLNMVAMSLDGAPFYDTDGNGAADSDFRQNGGVIAYDVDNPGRGTACGRVIDVFPGTSRIQVDFETTMNAAGGTFVLIPAHRYAIRDPFDGVDDDANGVIDDTALTRDGRPMVFDADDLQIAIALDSNDDGTLNEPTEYYGTPAAGLYDPRNTDHRTLREIRFNLVLRSRTPDIDWTDGFMQSTENRAPAGANDGFRRRVLQTIVKPRNVGFRGA